MNSTYKDYVRPIVNLLRRALAAHRENGLSRAQDKVTARTVERDILLLCHSLEKGMGVPDARPGYGKAKARKLIQLLKKAPDYDVPTDGYVYIEGVCALRAWCNWQTDHGVDPSDIDILADFLSSSEIELDALPNVSGVLQWKEWDWSAGAQIASQFIRSRRSVRQFSEREVDDSALMDVVRLSLCAPSACNRQPCMVYFAKGLSGSVVSKSICGNRGFESSIHQFAVITCDRALFSGAEIYQWFINGGIFLYSMALSMHAYGIESCIFQWIVGDDGTEMRETLSIPDRESIVGVLGFGYPERDAKVLVAQRREPQEIASFHE